MGTTNNSVFIDSKTFSLRELFSDKFTVLLNCTFNYSGLIHPGTDQWLPGSLWYQ